MQIQQADIKTFRFIRVARACFYKEVQLVHMQKCRFEVKNVIKGRT